MLNSHQIRQDFKNQRNRQQSLNALDIIILALIIIATLAMSAFILHLACVGIVKIHHLMKGLI